MNNFGCLMPHEEIMVNEGIVKIIDLKEGDEVMTVDGTYEKVEKIWNFNKPVYYVVFANGEHVECSISHRFCVNKSKMDKEASWKTIGELREGDEVFFMSIVNETGNTQIKKVKISRIFYSGAENPVYDLTVKNSTTYISANGLINHSL